MSGRGAAKVAGAAPAKAAGAAPVKAAGATPPVAQIKAAGAKQAESAGLTPAQRTEVDAEAQRVADQDPATNRQELSGKEESPDPIEEQKLGTNKEQEDLNAKQESELAKKLKTPAGVALVAALGLTIALVVAFSVKAAQAAKACTDCRDFKITITSINPTPGGIPVFGDLFGMIKPSTVDVAYSCPTSYEPLEGKESFTFKDTDMPEFDGQTFTVEKVLGKNKVRVKCGSSDCSGLTGKKGSINPNCADFNDRFNDQVNKAGEATGNALGSFFKGAASNMGTVIFVIIICVVFYMIFSSMASNQK
jgi:hypothetical protein